MILKEMIFSEHAEKRAMERYGISFGFPEQQWTICQIVEGKATFLEKRNRWVSVWAVDLPDGSWIPVVFYNRKVMKIPTLLPKQSRSKSKLTLTNA